MKFVISRIDDDRKTFEIIQEVGVLKTIFWIIAFYALQVVDKVIRFSHQIDNEEVRESIVNVIESLQDLQISRRRQTKITTFVTKKQ